LDAPLTSLDVVIAPADLQRISLLCGPFDDNLRLIERQCLVQINNRDEKFRLIGKTEQLPLVRDLLLALYEQTVTAHGKASPLSKEQVHIALQELLHPDHPSSSDDHSHTPLSVKTKKGPVKGRNPNQQRYLQNILQHDISFGVGPAGTGKTYLAVACAVDALEKNHVRRIVLTRPAVEAGEKLGFLPGDLAQKVDPYLKPLYDALFDMLGFEKVEKYLERGTIEIAPLAYMRGRTLSDAFIILDEAQNTTTEQMKMFLTRLGFNAKAVITGDVTQVDLPRGQYSGLKHAIDVLQHLPSLSFNFFQAKDVVRHPVVAQIVQAYEAWDAAQTKTRATTQAVGQTQAHTQPPTEPSGESKDNSHGNHA
jgi:phosphate starvation-inducible PhoH-like protein